MKKQKAIVVGGNFTVLDNGMLRISRPKGKITEMRAFIKAYEGNDIDGAFIYEFYEDELT